MLADVRHRLDHLDRRPKDWGAFFAAAPGDPLLPEGLAVARRLAEDHEVVYLTGRPEHCRVDTQAWLTRHALPPGRVLMRSSRDRRPARLVKIEVLRRLAAERRVAVLVDDDLAVAVAAEAAGFPVLVADWMSTGGPTGAVGNVLAAAQEQDGRT